MAVLVNNSINSLSVADRASGDPSKGGDPNYPNPQAPTHFRICSPERPPEFTRETENHLNIGRIWYNSLQVSVQKRYSCGLTFSTNHTLEQYPGGQLREPRRMLP